MRHLEFHAGVLYYRLFTTPRANEINQGQSTRGVACKQGRQLNVPEETKCVPFILPSSSERVPLSLSKLVTDFGRGRGAGDQQLYAGDEYKM